MLESPYEIKGIANSILFSSSNTFKNNWNINILDFNSVASPSIYRPSRIEMKLKMTQIGIWRSRTRKCSQKHEINNFCPWLFQPSNLVKYLIDYLLEYLSNYERIKAECNQIKSINGLNQTKAVNQSMNQSTNQPITSNSSIAQIRLTNRSSNQSIHTSIRSTNHSRHQSNQINESITSNQLKSNQPIIQRIKKIQIKSIQSINSNQLNQSLSQSD